MRNPGDPLELESMYLSEDDPQSSLDLSDPSNEISLSEESDSEMFSALGLSKADRAAAKKASPKSISSESLSSIREQSEDGSFRLSVPIAKQLAPRSGLEVTTADDDSKVKLRILMRRKPMTKSSNFNRSLAQANPKNHHLVAPRPPMQQAKQTFSTLLESIQKKLLESLKSRHPSKQLQKAPAKMTQIHHRVYLYRVNRPKMHRQDQGRNRHLRKLQKEFWRRVLTKSRQRCLTKSHQRPLTKRCHQWPLIESRTKKSRQKQHHPRFPP
ncbi:hypothetical protein BC829DRAFT_225523 [Chytridium lagenaria]|nr:hypothetical protein BC829DRAFT_225523 [Chytridium lagenaria]